MKKSIDRRSFVKVTSLSGTALMLGFLSNEGCSPKAKPAPNCAPMQPNAFLKIESNGKITVYVGRQEMGQGVNTSLPQIVAEELDADWKDVHTEIAAFGSMKEGAHDTGGSQSVLTDYTSLRNAGAVAKAMLVTAAAKQWNVQPDQCTTENGWVINSSSKDKLSYGELVCTAASLPVPKDADVKLKPPEKFTLVGKASPKKNLQDILLGKSIYGIDVKVPGMVYASIERCPVLHGKVVSVDDSAAKRVNGFIKTVVLEGTQQPMHVHAGVAVIATNIWSAMKARKLLTIVWDEGKKNRESTDELFKKFEVYSKKGPVVESYKKGNVHSVKADAATSLESAFTHPFLAHGTMEPMNFIAQVKDGSCEVWGGLQLPDWAAGEMAKELGLKKENIKINLALIGGGFGRRLHFDYALEAVKIARQIDKPVHLIWDRTDDIRNDVFRPASYHKMKASWSAEGKLLSWQHHHIAPAINKMIEGPEAKNYAEMLGGASSDFWYDVPNVYTGFTHVDFNVNLGWLRAVEICVNVFPIESFIDEVARKMNKDPLQFRLGLLATMPERKEENLQQNPKRIAGVLQLAAEKIGYGKTLPANHYIGLASHHFTFAKAYAAHAIEIEMLEPKKFRIVKVVAAIDCGIVINPDGLKNQMEGGIAFALSQALKGEITVKDSRVVQDSFFNYEPLRFHEMPPVEVHYINSNEEPGGSGETGMPTVTPALCNALAAAGYRPYRLPIKNEGYEWV